MATKGAEERKGEDVPVVTGTKSLLATFVCLHGFMSAVNLAALIVVHEHHRSSQGDGWSVSSGVDMLAAVLLLALIFTGWWRRVLPFFALLMVIVTVKNSVRIFYTALSGICCYFVEPVVVVAVIAVFQLVVSFWSAKDIVRRQPYRTDGQEPSKKHLH